VRCGSRLPRRMVVDMAGAIHRNRTDRSSREKA
jgi:hypothetical protein